MMLMLLWSLLFTTASGFGMYEAVEYVPVGGQWVVYNDTSTGVGPPPAECEAAVGTKVPDSCCAGFDPAFDLVFADNFGASCNGLSFGTFVGRAFIGCEDGEITYGETCAEDGLAYPWPGDTDPLSISKNVTVDECGCGVVLSGVGCHKATDTGDGRIFYVLLAEECVPAED